MDRAVESHAYYDRLYTRRHSRKAAAAGLAFWKDHFATQFVKSQCQRGCWVDLGCGTGMIDWWIARANPVEIIGIDFSPVALRYARILRPHEGPGKLEWLLADFSIELPFDAETFDGCICSHTLEHIRNIDQFLGEMVRITKSGGRLVIVVPHLYHYDSPDHFWHFTLDQLSDLLDPWGMPELGTSSGDDQLTAVVHLPDRGI